MLAQMISKLDHAVLEIALIDAFCDMCIHEGEEFTEELKDYLKSIDDKTNTEEQDNAFFELSMPYIQNSIERYSSTIIEAEQKEIVTGSDKNELARAKAGAVGADTLKQLKTKGRDLAKKELSESEEAKIWEGVVGDVVSAAKEGVKKAANKSVIVGKSLGKAIPIGIAAAAKNFQKNLKGFKIPADKVPDGKAPSAS